MRPADTRAGAGNSQSTFDSFWLISLLALVFGIAAFGTDMYLPAFPAIRRSFDTTPEAVQLSLSIFLYGNAAGHLLFGPLSDRFGRKPILLFGLGAYALSSFGCAFGNDITHFQISRLLQGAAAASGPVLVRALINDRFERSEAAQMLALLTGMMAFAAMLTPSIGGLLVQVARWQWIFFAIGGGGIALLALSIFNVRETLAPARRTKRLGVRNLIGGYLEIGRSLQFWSYVLPPSLMFAAVFAYAAVNSFLLIDELGMAEHHYGISYSFAACAYVAGSLSSRWLIRRVSIDRAIVVGLSLGLATALAAVTASYTSPMSIALVIAPGLCIFFATSLILPIGFSASVSLFPRRGGSASALAGFTQLGVAGFSAGIGAALYDTTTRPLHLFTLGCCIAACVLWIAGSGIRKTAAIAK